MSALRRLRMSSIWRLPRRFSSTSEVVPPASMAEMTGWAKASFQASCAVWRSLMARTARGGDGVGAAAVELPRQLFFGAEVGFEEDGVAGGLESAKSGFLIRDELFDKKAVGDAAVASVDVGNGVVGLPHLPDECSRAEEGDEQRDDEHLTEDSVEAGRVQMLSPRAAPTLIEMQVLPSRCPAS